MALKLSTIKILNYKSINNIYLDIKKHDDSYTTIFVGKNETGKSNLLNAISFAAQPPGEFNYDELRNAQNEQAQFVDFYFTYSFENDNEWKHIFQENATFPADFVELIEFNSIESNLYLSKTGKNFNKTNNVIFHISNDESLEKYAFKKSSITEENPYLYDICYVKGLAENDITNETVENTSLYKRLNEEALQTILNDVFASLLENNQLNVSKWKHSKEYLITETIDLNVFKTNNNTCYPLKNIFNLAGYKTQKDIEAKINSLTNSPKNINKLASQLERITTEYISKIWAESKIKVKIDIQKDLNLDVYIIDETDEENTYYMSDRSEGFKQFISLILSSILYTSHRQRYT